MSIRTRAFISLAIGTIAGFMAYALPDFIVHTFVGLMAAWIVLDLIDWMSNAPLDPDETEERNL